MIRVPSSHLSLLTAVFRHCVCRSAQALPPVVVFEAGPQGLHAYFWHDEIAVEHRQPGSFGAGRVCLSLDALTESTPRRSDLIILKSDGSPYPPPRPLPRAFVINPPRLLRALEEAGRTAYDYPIRFSLHCLLLRGRLGEVVASDGRQLLIQGGFQFPWDEDLLIPRAAVFGCRAIDHRSSIEVGRSNSHVTFRILLWLVHLRIATHVHYPDVNRVIAAAAGTQTSWHIGRADAAFLMRALRQLAARDECAQATVDLDRSCLVRFRGRDQSVIEAELVESSYSGRPVQFSINPRYLLRMLRLGFSTVQVIDAATPLLCKDEHRTYAVMPLDLSLTQIPADGAQRIRSSEPIPVGNPDCRASEKDNDDE